MVLGCLNLGTKFPDVIRTTTAQAMANIYLLSSARACPLVYILESQYAREYREPSESPRFTRVPCVNQIYNYYGQGAKRVVAAMEQRREKDTSYGSRRWELVARRKVLAQQENFLRLGLKLSSVLKLSAFQSSRWLCPGEGPSSQFLIACHGAVAGSLRVCDIGKSVVVLVHGRKYRRVWHLRLACDEEGLEQRVVERRAISRRSPLPGANNWVSCSQLPVFGPIILNVHAILNIFIYFLPSWSVASNDEVVIKAGTPCVHNLLSSFASSAARLILILSSHTQNARQLLKKLSTDTMFAWNSYIFRRDTAASRISSTL